MGRLFKCILIRRDIFAGMAWGIWDCIRECIWKILNGSLCCTYTHLDVLIRIGDTYAGLGEGRDIQNL